MDLTALYNLSYGLYVLGVRNVNGCEYGGCVVDAVAQVSAGSAPIVIVATMKNNNTPVCIKQFNQFTLSVLGEMIDPFVIANFGFQSARTEDKWKNVDHVIKDGLPTFSDAIAYLHCNVIETKELPTHTMFTCEILDAWRGTNNSSPLIYGDYLREMRPASAAAFKAFKEAQNNTKIL
ncbi:MAG: flavin reductase [Christensenellaceae bacterium]|jgi:flavin reductase (DIM6/NTAB) family NADH-FMN oxidoreductase RutF|nr:flavin reductase [Christensenellaceae bacterium]